MESGRIRQRTELLIVGWPWGVADSSRVTPAYVVEYEDGRWEFHLAGYGIVRGDRFNGEREIVTMIARAFGPYS